jgi:hypothetical protein
LDILKRTLLDTKISEGIADIDTFITDNGISDESLIQSFSFSKEFFPDKALAVDWVRSHGFLFDIIDESETSYRFTQIQESDLSELSDIDLTTGISVSFGQLKPSENPFALDGREQSIKFSGSLPQVIELAKVVSGTHVNYGPVEITKEMLRSFADNFDGNAVGVDIMIDFDHKQAEAAGWVKEVFLSFDEQTLLGVIRWTEKGAQALSSRTFRYISPEFTLNYTHPHTGVSHGPTLLGGGLVNRPFLKMDAIVTFKENTNNSKEVKMETIALNEHKAITSDLEKTISDFKLSEEKAKKLIEGQKEEITKLSTELKEIKEAKEKAEIEAKHEKLFSEGKISKAQLVALNEGKDMYEVLALSEKLNTEPNGKDGDNPVIELSETDEKACKALGISKEDYVKYNL